MARLEGFFDDDILEEEDDDEDQVDHPKGEDQDKEEDDDKLEIEITPDVASKWKTDPAESIKHEDNDKDFGARVKKRITKLVAAGSEEGRRRQAAEKQLAEVVAYTQQVVAEKADLERRLQESSSKSFASQASEADTQAKLATGDYKRAAINGDADGMSEANERITESKVKAAGLKRDSEAATQAAERARLVAVEATKKAQEALQLKQQASQQPAPTPSAKTVQWLKDNPWFDPSGKDSKSLHTISIHTELLEDGMEEGSDEYFRALNDGVRAKYKNLVKEEPQQRRSGTVRTERTSRDDSQRTSPINGNKLTFTKGQMNTARSLGLVVSDEKKTKSNLLAYAKQIAKVEATRK